MDKAEAARLRAVAENAQRFAGLGRRDEARQHHAVAPGLARADGVEQPRDGDGQVFFARVSKREKFVRELGARVAPARLAGRPDEQVVVLAERRLGALAIDFRGGGQQQRRGIFCGGAQQDLHLVEAGFQNVQRGFDDQLHADGRGEMQNKFRVRRQLRQFGVGGNLRLDEAEIPVLCHRAQVVPAAGGQIVNDHNAFAILQQPLHQVRADEARAAGDENVFASFHLSALAMASASFSRNSAFSIFSASCGFER